MVQNMESEICIALTFSWVSAAHQMSQWPVLCCKERPRWTEWMMLRFGHCGFRLVPFISSVVRLKYKFKLLWLLSSILPFFLFLTFLYHAPHPFLTCSLPCTTRGEPCSKLQCTISELWKQKEPFSFFLWLQIRTVISTPLYCRLAVAS